MIKNNTLLTVLSILVIFLMIYFINKNFEDQRKGIISMSILIEDIKQEEGFGGNSYLDTEGFETIGYGTKLPLTKKEAELLLEYRLNNFMSQVKSSLYRLEIKDQAWKILYHMSYQLGLDGLLGFKDMLTALENQDYKEAAKEGRDSLWYKQTPLRAERLMSRMEQIK